MLLSAALTYLTLRTPVAEMSWLCFSSHEGDVKYAFLIGFSIFYICPPSAMASDGDKPTIRIVPLGAGQGQRASGLVVKIFLRGYN